MKISMSKIAVLMATISIVVSIFAIFVSGPQGEPGPTGETGPTGAVGATGAKGDNGTDGLVGPMGTQGPRGANGTQGTPGEFGGTWSQLLTYEGQGNQTINITKPLIRVVVTFDADNVSTHVIYSLKGKETGDLAVYKDFVIAPNSTWVELFFSFIPPELCTSKVTVVSGSLSSAFVSVFQLEE